MLKEQRSGRWIGVLDYREYVLSDWYDFILFLELLGETYLGNFSANTPIFRRKYPFAKYRWKRFNLRTNFVILGCWVTGRPKILIVFTTCRLRITRIKIYALPVVSHFPCWCWGAPIRTVLLNIATLWPKLPSTFELNNIFWIFTTHQNGQKIRSTSTNTILWSTINSSVNFPMRAQNFHPYHHQAMHPQHKNVQLDSNLIHSIVRVYMQNPWKYFLVVFQGVNQLSHVTIQVYRISKQYTSCVLFADGSKRMFNPLIRSRALI